MIITKFNGLLIKYNFYCSYNIHKIYYLNKLINPSMNIPQIPSIPCPQ